MPRVLVIGYGNPGRGDDGLGPALAAAIAEMNLPDVTVESDCQLTVDHTTQIAAHDLVVFADAAVGLTEPWRLSAIGAEPGATLGSHDLSPSAALHLTRLLYGKAPPGWVLAIGGIEFDDVREGLCPVAQENLALAVRSLKDWLAQSADAVTGPGQQWRAQARAR
jgi:hydrogenase maturation protease